MAKLLVLARALAGMCLLAGALAVVRLASVEQSGLVPAVSAVEMCRETRPANAELGVAPGLVQWSGR